MNSNYKIKTIKKCCANCDYSEDDILLEIGSWYKCPNQPKEVSWNGYCDKYENLG